MLPPRRRETRESSKADQISISMSNKEEERQSSMYDIYGKEMIMDSEPADEPSMEDSENSVSSLSSISEVAEDASSPPPRLPASASSSSSSSSSNGPLYELSELMAQLPMKRGLSRYYQGKSQSFTSLASVKSIEDLAKKGNNYHYKTKMMKSCKSYGCGLDGHNNNSSSRCFSPKAAISKKVSSSSRGCVLSSLGRTSAAALVITVNLPSSYKSASDLQ